MREDIKEKWIAALESLDYKKGCGTMREEHSDGSFSYCCLGVLTDLYCKETGVEFEKLFSDPEDTDAKYGTSMLPKLVQEWCGISNVKLMNKLAAENDSNMWFPVRLIREEC